MIKLTEQEWKDIPKNKKRKTPLTKLRQWLWSAGNPDESWITETVNFIIVKEGDKHADKIVN